MCRRMLFGIRSRYLQLDQYLALDKRMAGNTTNKITWLRYFEICMLIMGIIGPFVTAPHLLNYIIRIVIMRRDFPYQAGSPIHF